ncbi:MAG: NAD-dependent epimerase/dehydratase family protein [Pyrobaculum sp.]
MILDNLPIGTLDNLGDALGTVKFVKCDARNFEVVERAVRDIDAVVHMAIFINVAETIEKPDLYIDVKGYVQCR